LSQARAKAREQIEKAKAGGEELVAYEREWRVRTTARNVDVARERTRMGDGRHCRRGRCQSEHLNSIYERCI
jgi:hypothetical protein